MSLIEPHFRTLSGTPLFLSIWSIRLGAFKLLDFLRYSVSQLYREISAPLELELKISSALYHNRSNSGRLAAFLSKVTVCSQPR